MVLNWPVFKKHSPADGPSLHAQDNLHSHGQHLIILQSDRGWGNSLLDTRYSEHAGPRVSNKFVKWLPIRPEPNMRRRDLVTAKLCFRPQYIFAKIGTNIWLFTFFGFVPTEQQQHLSRNLN